MSHASRVLEINRGGEKVEKEEEEEEEEEEEKRQPKEHVRRCMYSITLFVP